MRKKFGIKVPNSTKEASLLDKTNGDSKWHDAIQKELMALQKLNVWRFHLSNHKMSKECQKAPLRMIFDVKKEDLRRKARHVVGGHEIDSDHLEAYSSVVQSMSVRILLTLAHKHKLKVMSGDVGNAFPNAPTKEKVHAVAGEKFGERMGCLVEIIKTSYGMSTASRSFALCLGDFIRTLGYVPSRADPETWIKKDDNYDGYSFMSAHVDDFLIIGTDPEPVMNAFKDEFDIRNDELNPSAYLVLEWEGSELGKTKIHKQKHIKEAMSQIESSLGAQIKKENVPFHPKYHPELDESRLLADEEITEHQRFIGILQWI